MDWHERDQLLLPADFRLARYHRADLRTLRDGHLRCRQSRLCLGDAPVCGRRLGAQALPHHRRARSRDHDALDRRI